MPQHGKPSKATSDAQGGWIEELDFHSHKDLVSKRRYGRGSRAEDGDGNVHLSCWIGGSIGSKVHIIAKLLFCKSGKLGQIKRDI